MLKIFHGEWFSPFPVLLLPTHCEEELIPLSSPVKKSTFGIALECGQIRSYLRAKERGVLNVNPMKSGVSSEPKGTSRLS